MQQTTNPYAAPSAVNHNPFQQNNFGYEVYANRLIVDKFVELPARCYKTGEPVSAGVDGTNYRKNLFYCSPLWALLIILSVIGIILYTIIYYSTRKELVIAYSLSNKAKQSLRCKRLVGYPFSFLIFIGSLYSLFQATDTSIPLGLIGIVLTLLALIITRSITTVVRIKDHSNGRFTLTGASPAYLSYLQKQR